MARLPVARLRRRSDGRLNWPGFWLVGWLFMVLVASVGAVAYYNMGIAMFGAFVLACAGSAGLSFMGPERKRTGERNNRAWLAGLGGALCAAFIAMAMHDLRILDDNGELESVHLGELSSLPVGRVAELRDANHIAVHGSHSYRHKGNQHTARVVGIVPEDWHEGEPVPAWLSYGERELPPYRVGVLRRVERSQVLAAAIRGALTREATTELVQAPVFESFIGRSQWADEHEIVFRFPIWMSLFWLVWVVFLRIREIGA